MVLKKGRGCGGIRDVVRGTILCADNATIAKVLKSLSADKYVTITNVKDGHSACKAQSNACMYSPLNTTPPGLL